MPNAIACGVGCNLDANAAAIQAIIECAQSASFCLYDNERGLSDLTGTEHPPVHFKYLHKAGKDSSIELATVPSVEIRSAEHETQEVLERLNDFASHLIVTDLTNLAFKIPVVRVVIPNFENAIADGMVKKSARGCGFVLRVLLARLIGLFLCRLQFLFLFS